MSFHYSDPAIFYIDASYDATPSDYVSMIITDYGMTTTKVPFWVETPPDIQKKNVFLVRKLAMGECDAPGMQCREREKERRKTMMCVARNEMTFQLLVRPVDDVTFAADVYNIVDVDPRLHDV
ncbi:hypothetical protein V8G54_020435 [Vigna mungo]|uniref:Uncharacterized protein n=1 Tax=Vigna mungo TaxID=3915 RepID=A0AAQ3RTD9_VIGMU